MNIIKALYWRTRIFFLALRWMRQLNLGDKVMYQGRRWTLVQGVRSPIWEMVAGSERVEAHESQIKKDPTIENYIGSFRSGWRFYMGYWYSIWMREGIKPWMRGCNIWGRSPNKPTSEPGT